MCVCAFDRLPFLSVGDILSLVNVVNISDIFVRVRVRTGFIRYDRHSKIVKQYKRETLDLLFVKQMRVLISPQAFAYTTLGMCTALLFTLRDDSCYLSYTR